MPNLELNRTIRSEGLERRGKDVLGTDFFLRRPSWVGGQISEIDSIFLAGLANFSGARSVIEIGVASGWSSSVLLQAVSANRGDAVVHGVDLSPTFYLNDQYRTGQAVEEVVPDLQKNYRILTGKLAYERMDEIGRIDFAFIDGHHYHPWATLDLISILPFIEKGRWVALHDINLCTFERHKHTNRGPFYLYNFWPDQKIHSTQSPTMIGGISIDRNPVNYLPIILEILYTPWECRIDVPVLGNISQFIGRHFGSSWKERFAELFSNQQP